MWGISVLRVAMLVMALGNGTALAQGLEVIRLRHRMADQLIPELRPLLAPGATLTGQGSALFVGTTPANLAELRQALEMLDRPLRRLMISVRHAGRQESQGSALVLGAEVGRRTAVIGGFSASANAGWEDVSQRVQTVEGGRALINVGQSAPFAVRQVVPTPRGPVVSDTLVWRESGAWFYVEPRLSGDRVILEIVAANDAPGATPGSAEVRRVISTISGRLGEWIPLGGSLRQEAEGGGSRLDDRQIWLLVEEMP